MHSSARTFSAIIRLFMDDEWSKSTLTKRTGLHHITVARYVAALHNEKVIRISSWQKPRSGHGALVAHYSFNDSDLPDVRHPKPALVTSAESSQRHRAKLAAIKTLHLLAGKPSNE